MAIVDGEEYVKRFDLFVGTDGLAGVKASGLPPQSIFAVWEVREDGPTMVGTAFAITDTVCMTASHVLLDKDGVFSGRFRLVSMFEAVPPPSPGFPEGTIFYKNSPIVDVVTTYPGLDITLFSVASRKGWPAVEMDPLCLSLVPPIVGEECLALGYTVDLSEGPQPNQDKPRQYFHRQLHQELGAVTELHIERRDSVLVKFPSFAMDGNLRHQMSGSPVFRRSSDGTLVVCGVVSTGFDTENPFGYVSLLWPIAGLTLPGSDDENSPSVAILSLEGRIAVDGLEVVKIDGWTGTKRRTELSALARLRYLGEKGEKYESREYLRAVRPTPRPSRAQRRREDRLRRNE